METRKITKESIRFIGGLIIAGIFIIWLYLMALNGRYMYVNMVGDDLIIDKWTREIYVNHGEPNLTNMKNLMQEKYKLPSLIEYDESLKNSKK